MYVFISLLVNLKPSDNFKKKQTGSSHKAPTSFVKGTGGIKKRKNAFPIVEGEVSGDLLVLM